MNLGTFFYLIIIRPLELLFDVLFGVSTTFTHNMGLSIIVVSLVVNFLTLPLYIRADSIQREEEDKGKRIRLWENHIKKAFSGDERFMMLQTLYRQNDYKPYRSLKNAIPLFLEIPFFIAAYRFLSGLIILDGVSFGPISDLAQPDRLLNIGGQSINILPILMTFINIISSLIYGKNSTLKNKIQMFGLASVFLVLLYNSPAALAFYWTLNNLFSLIKNIIYLIVDKKSSRSNKKSLNEKSINDKGTRWIFISSALFAVALIGLYIPVQVIGSSVFEFMNVASSDITNPILYIIYDACIVFGIAVFWFGVIYYLSSRKAKSIVASIMFGLSLVGILNYSMFSDKNNRLSQYLLYEVYPEFSTTQYVQSAVVLVCVALLCFLLVKKWKGIVICIMTAGIALLSIVSIYKMRIINTKYTQKYEMLKEYSDIPEIKLSKNGKNVVVIMMDRMISSYIPYIMNEKPEIKDQFAGFTFYPNCVSFGASTNTGNPGLYGGYEYTPEEMNKRANESLKDKQNEALKVMPVMFLKEGFDVSVSDPTYANYEWIPDLRIFDDYPEIKKYISMGRLNDEDTSYLIDYKIKRNMFFYGLMRTAPVFLRNRIYEEGNYNESCYYTGIAYQMAVNKHFAYGVSDVFYNSYNVLDKMDNITSITDDSSNNFFMMSNDTTHSPTILQEPDYIPFGYVDNYQYDQEKGVRKNENGEILDIFVDKTDEDGEDYIRVLNYDVVMATMIKLGEWMNYLKENDVYDNTKIIIVSDHGSDEFYDKNFEYFLYYEDGIKYCYDLFRFHSTLLVKDFNSQEFVTDNSFMTNADVPTIATKDLINDPVNPFTGKPITSNRKEEGNLQLQVTSTWSTDKNGGNTFLPEHWFSVHDNIFDSNNWSYLGYY